MNRVCRAVSSSKILSLTVLAASVCVSFHASAVTPIAPPLDTLVAEYVQSTQLIEEQLFIIKKDAPSCGMIGGQMAGRMDESIKGQRKDVGTILNAVKQGKAGQPTIREGIIAVEKSNTELKSNLGMARYGLTTNNASCKRAAAAFEVMVTQSLAMPKKLKTILAAL